MIIMLVFIFIRLLPDTQIPVYNSSSVRKSVTVNMMIELSLKYFQSHPFDEILWRPNLVMTSSKFVFTLLTLLKQVIPGILIDGAMKSTGKTLPV